MKVVKGLVVGVLASSILLAGCGANEKESVASEKENVKSEEVKVKNVSVKDWNDRVLEFEKVPSKIISLTTGELNNILALEGSLIGRPTAMGPVDDSLQSIEEVGNVQQPDLEKIASLQPDLIIAHSSFNIEHLESLEATGAKVFMAKANSVEDIKTNITTYGEILHKEEKAKEVIEKIDSYKGEELDVKALIVYGTPGEYFAALPESLPGDILRLVGGQNIAKDFPKLPEMPQYAKLSMEDVIKANPDVIYLLAHGDVNVVKEAFLTELKKSSAWQETTAVKNNAFEVLPNDIFGANPGAKVIDALEYLGNDLKSVGK